MAYISTEEVKAIRENFKKEFTTKDGWKFSIKRENYSNVQITILKAPVNLIGYYSEREYYSLPEHDLEKYFPKELADKFELMFKFVRTENYFDKSDSMTDYFHVSHYYDISVGRWDKAFEVSK